MHEVGMAYDIAVLVDRYAEQHAIEQVDAVRLRVGEYAGVELDALELGFGAARKRVRHCAHARLAIEVVEGSVRCDCCGARFHLEAPGEACPVCGSCERTYLSGRELKVDAIEYVRA